MNSSFGKPDPAALAALAGAVFDAVSDPIILTRTDGTITMWNGGAERVFGYRADEVLGRPVAILYCEADLPVVRNLTARVAAGECIHQAEVRCIDKQARELHMLLSLAPLRDGNGDVTQLVGVTKDITETQRLQAQLSLVNRAIDSSFSGFHIIDAGGVVVYANRACLEMWGYRNAAEVVGRPLSDLLADPEDHRNVMRSLREKGACTCGFRARRADGSEFDAHMYARRDRDGAGNEIFALTSVDVTATRATALTVERFFEQPFNLHLIAGLDGVVHRANRGWRTHLGYDPEELTGQYLYDLVHPDDLKATTGEMARLGQGRTTFYFENRYRHRDGGYRTLAWSAIAAPDEGLVYAVASDITETRQAEAALRESEARFKTITESSPDAIFITDHDGRYTYVNHAATDMLGYTQDEFLQMGIADLVRAGEHDQQRARFAQLLAKGSLFTEMDIIGKDGSTVPVELNAIVLPNGLVFGACRDISDRRTMMATLAQADRMSSMGLLAAGVAHEINNPLSYVLHNLESLTSDLAELAARGGAVDEQQLGDLRQRADVALDGTQRIRDIARGLGRFSRVDIGELEPVDVRQVIDNALKIAANEIRFRARVVRELDAVPDVLASEGRLAQVFLNLMVNAAHAIEEGDIEGNEIRVRTWAAGGQVYAAVSDTGRGVDEEHVERMFDPFFTTKEAGMGSGLGLSISRTIVDSYGGVITVASRPGNGTTITVRLPATAESRKPIPASPQEPAAVTGRILIVDDEEPLRRITERMLSAHVTACAASGNQARRILEADNGFDVILCDIMMPDGSGVELHEWLVENHPELAGRVVFVSGGVFTPRSREYVARLGSPVLEKPYSRSQLLRAVQQVMASGGGD